MPRVKTQNVFIEIINGSTDGSKWISAPQLNFVLGLYKVKTILSFLRNHFQIPIQK